MRGYPKAHPVMTVAIFFICAISKYNVYFMITDSVVIIKEFFIGYCKKIFYSECRLCLF